MSWLDDQAKKYQEKEATLRYLAGNAMFVQKETATMNAIKTLDLTTTPAPSEIKKPGQYLGEVMELVRRTPTPKTDEDIGKMQLLINQKQEYLLSLFGCEVQTKMILDAQINELKEQRDKALSKKLYVDAGYLPLSMDVLGWRDEKGNPKLALFDLKRSKVEMSGYHRGVGKYPSISPDYPTTIRKYYKDVTDRLQDTVQVNKYHDVIKFEKITATFSGDIPPDARKKIKDAIGSFEHVYLLAEPNWSTTEEVAYIDPDPIVVGWDGHQLWYVFDFDLTPVEEAALLQPYKP